MAWHVVKQGECMSSLAQRFGFADYRTIYEHPENAELREKRPNPGVLCPGDAVFVPERQPWKASVPIGEAKQFVLRTVTTKLRLFLVDEAGEPLAAKRFVVDVEGEELEGETTAEGLVEVDIPADASSARLRAWFDEQDVPKIDYALALGALDPVDAVTGVQARLNNLGFRCQASGAVDDGTRAAIRAFSAAHGLPEGDEVTDQLRQKLLELHDGS